MPTTPAGGRPPRRLATIDLGSNTVRYLLVEVDAGQAWRIVDRDQRVTRLGEGLAAAGALGEAPMARTGAAVREYAERARRLGAVEVRGSQLAGFAGNAADGRQRALRDQPYDPAEPLEQVAVLIENDYIPADIEDLVDAGVFRYGGQSPIIFDRLEPEIHKEILAVCLCMTVGAVYDRALFA